ncbi:MAG: hypothetical protein E6J79_20675, partial [Deltaproteobacteria bacterium]
MAGSAAPSATTSATRSTAALPPRSPGMPRRAPFSRCSDERRLPMRVTLVFPGIALPGFDSFNKRPSVDANFIDHGLASVGAAAKAAGHDVGLIDLRALTGWEHFRSLVRTSDTPVWGITSWSLHYPDAVRAMRVIKEERPEAVVVLGGVHATINTRQVMNNALAELLGVEELARLRLAPRDDPPPAGATAVPEAVYFLLADGDRIHRAFTDGRLRGAIGDYQRHSLHRGLAATLAWYAEASA